MKRFPSAPPAPSRKLPSPPNPDGAAPLPRPETGGSPFRARAFFPHSDRVPFERFPCKASFPSLEIRGDFLLSDLLPLACPLLFFLWVCSLAFFFDNLRCKAMVHTRSIRARDSTLSSLPAAYSDSPFLCLSFPKQRSFLGPNSQPKDQPLRR